MAAPLTISLDAMGGDFGPEVVVPGAELSLNRHPELRFLFFGDERRIGPLFKKHPKVAERSQLIHTDVAVAMDDKPSQALRKGRRNSSMWLAIQAVKKRQADAIVSAGNTGALMVMSKVCLKMLPEIERPALAAIWPTINAECIVLDVGANVGGSVAQLVDFSLMGSAMARAISGIETPTVALLNIGVEEIKGLDDIKKAHAILKNGDLPIDYRGFIEGDAIGQGVVDVVVCEGFTGNIALKTAEGTAKQMGTYFREAINRSVMSKIGAFFAQSAFRMLKAKLDPRQHNGGVFLGLNGLSIKSHGGTDAMGYASAIDLAYDVARYRLIDKISSDVERFHSAMEKEELAQ